MGNMPEKRLSNFLCTQVLTFKARGEPNNFQVITILVFCENLENLQPNKVVPCFIYVYMQTCICMSVICIYVCNLFMCPCMHVYVFL